MNIEIDSNGDIRWVGRAAAAGRSAEKYTVKQLYEELMERHERMNIPRMPD